MAQEKKGLFQRWGESLKKKRSWILYGTAVATLFLTAACWTLLPERVVMQAAVVGRRRTLWPRRRLFWPTWV